MQDATLDKLQEDKFHDLREGLWNLFPFKPSSISVSPLSPHRHSSSFLLPTPSKTTYKKLSHEEMLTRREKGLCYNCDEKFHPGHKCKTHFFLLVVEETKVDNTTLSESLAAPDLDHLLVHDVHNEISSAQISFNALLGLPAPKALRLF